MTALARQHPAPEFIAVRMALVDIYWQAAWLLLKPAVARNGLYTEEYIRDALRKGEMQLWMAEDNGEYTMAAVTEVANYPVMTVAAILFLGGEDLRHCIPFLAEIEVWARQNGAKRFYCTGRPGLERHLKKHGYQLTLVTLVKGLLDG